LGGGSPARPGGTSGYRLRRLCSTRSRVPRLCRQRDTRGTGNFAGGWACRVGGARRGRIGAEVAAGSDSSTPTRG